MMSKVAVSHLRKAAFILAMAAVCTAVGCSSDPPPPPQAEDLSPAVASSLIAQRWSHDELNHFTVTFHSDTLIGCGVQNDLWKHLETQHLGMAISTYELTEAGPQRGLRILRSPHGYRSQTKQGKHPMRMSLCWSQIESSYSQPSRKFLF
jgi:hypothetical protein